jgi:serine/threonine protein kinase
LVTAGDLIADYAVVDLLGSGGHGQFFTARPPQRLGLDADLVVVKVIAGGDDRQFARFTRELQMFAAVANPNLVQLYDAGQHEEWFFYSMEWCSGGSFDRAEALERADALRGVSQIARAAHSLHGAGIVHRDIRPSNMLRRLDGSAALADLGLAQLGSGSVTSMAPTESIGFLDPAVLLGDPTGPQTDIYSLAASLHWLLTGQHLFAGLDPSDPLKAVRTVLRQPARVARDLLRPAEADLIEASTSKELGARPSTAEQFAALVEELLGE